MNTSQKTFHHGANAAIDITQAPDNLAMAAISDRDIVAKLTVVNQPLTTTNTNLTSQLKRALETNATLVAKLNSTPPPTSKGAAGNALGGSNQHKPFDRKAWIASLDPMGYCWSHRYRRVCDDTSANCKSKLLGHIDSVTRANPQDGSTKSKPS